MFRRQSVEREPSIFTRTDMKRVTMLVKGSKPLEWSTTFP